MLLKQFVAWACSGCSTAPLSDYINNPAYQELIDESDYNGNTSDEMENGNGKIRKKRL